MDYRIILVVIGVIATAFGRCEAITCYSCTSLSNVTDSKCLDPFNPNGVDTCQGGSCLKTWSTSTVLGLTYQLVIRSCSPVPLDSDECFENDETVEGYMGTSCFCRTDYCNGGQLVNNGVKNGTDGQLFKPTLYNIIIGVAIAALTAVAWMNEI